MRRRRQDLDAGEDGPWAAWRDDLRRYKRRDWVTEPSLWTIAIYRFGTWTKRSTSIAAKPLTVVYAVLHLGVSLLTGISIPRSARIGGGLRIFHFGGIVIHPDARLGRRCTLGHGVTLGVRETEHDAPIVGDDVVLGAYAQLIGGVRIGSGAKIGAMSVVLADVPPKATAAGNPARVLSASSD